MNDSLRMTKAKHIFHCANKCCKLEYIDYDDSITDHFIYPPYGNRKAGVCIYNSARGSILIVQSRGRLFGCPKGTIEPGEDVQECALRELKEETGIQLHPSDIKKCIYIKNRSVYFFYDTVMEVGHLPTNAGSVENDVTGIAWIKINCLHDLINQDIIKLNSHTRYILNYFMNNNTF